MRPAAYKSIVDQIAAGIRSGEMPAGTKLPTHRALAAERRIALATATRVYSELSAMGLIAGEPGRGTFVRDQQGHDGLEPSRRLTVPRIADLSFNQPLATDQVTLLRHALREMSTSGNLDSLLYQQPPGGRSHERAIVATYLLDRNIDVPPARVLLTGGAQQALDCVLTSTAKAGEVIVGDALTYPGLKMVCTARGLDLVALPTTPDGPDLDALDRICDVRPVRAIYTMPTVHNPLGWTLDDITRERLASIARAHDVLLVEDGTYAFLDDQAPPPLQDIAPERTFHIASLSKNVATGLRFGFAVAPDQHVETLTRSLRATSWGAPGIVTALATGWIKDGTVTRLEEGRRGDARSRQQIARRALRGMEYTAHPASYFGWLRLPADMRADQAATRLAEAGILVSTAEAFAITPHAPHALRLSLATPALGDLEGALELLCSTLAAIPR